MTGAPASTKPSTAFLILTFAGAIAVGVIIAYLGITGQIGGTIP